MARHTRYPAGRDWLPEAFKQTAASSHPYQEPTPEERANQWIRMFVDHKISASAVVDALVDLLGHCDEEVTVIIANWQAWPNDEQLREDLRPYAGRIYS